MIPKNITKEHIIKALKEIDQNGVPSRRNSKDYLLLYKETFYPPKYVISLANKYANGKELKSDIFNGGKETNNFLNNLNFKIVQTSLNKTIKYNNISQNTIYVKEKNKGHNERCPECKITVESMLKSIYGSVINNYKINISTNVEDYKEFPFYRELKNIYLKLLKYRGYKKFIRVRILPRCDYFVPNPGFILEFDESQHFTSPRKITLENYPKNLILGFSSLKWINLCNKINAKDNNPPFRDEQRAWYDTLRDFLPLIKGLNPTVRLYSNEIQWCSLNPEDPKDVETFKKYIEMKKNNQSSDWVATIILQSNGFISNEIRLLELSKIVSQTLKNTNGDGVIIFPGGWFNSEKEEAKSLYDWVENQLRDLLNINNRKIIVSLGIDGRVFHHAEDQIGIAISKNGIEAIGRKFYPAPQEEGYVKLAMDSLSKEENKPRIFELNGRKYFICACYDSFGVRKKRIPRHGDIILDLVHGFYSKGEGNSGEVYFAKHGFAGASKEWDSLVFGAAIFFNRKIPNNWPSGVYWDQGDKSTQKWSYKDNPIVPLEEFELEIPEGKALVRIFTHD